MSVREQRASERSVPSRPHVLSERKNWQESTAQQIVLLTLTDSAILCSARQNILSPRSTKPNRLPCCPPLQCPPWRDAKPGGPSAAGQLCHRRGNWPSSTTSSPRPQGHQERARLKGAVGGQCFSGTSRVRMHRNCSGQSPGASANDIQAVHEHSSPGDWCELQPLIFNDLRGVQHWLFIGGGAEETSIG